MAPYTVAKACNICAAPVATIQKVAVIALLTAADIISGRGESYSTSETVYSTALKANTECLALSITTISPNDALAKLTRDQYV